MTSVFDIAAIQRHYDRLSPLYHRFWGEHIHHGFWREGESRDRAQRGLVERLATTAELPRRASVLDVGCGLGGSALWLASELDCSVLGITISPVQARIATERARRAGLEEKVRIEVRDANQLDAIDESFDAVWIVECSEHLFDKARFFMNCARLLRPGGRLALCAWLAQADSPAAKALVRDVCRGMLCPSLGTMAENLSWIRAAGFERVHGEDITPSVAPTWDRVGLILQRRDVSAIVRHGTEEMQEFARACSGIKEAYATGAMAYGLFAATMPEARR